MKIRSLIMFTLIILLFAFHAACSSGQKENSKPSERSMKDAKGCVDGNCENGSGVYVYESGDKYSGEFKNAKRNGKGDFEYTNGDLFSGNFKDDQKDGPGIYKFKNGDTYTGEFVNGIRSGKGSYTFQGGTTFEGLFKEDGVGGNGNLIMGEASRECDLKNRQLFCNP